MTILYAPQAPTRSPYLETELFSTGASRHGRSGDSTVFDRVGDPRHDCMSRQARVSARAAYQEVLFGRAILVDIRPQGQRRQEGEVHPSLAPIVLERKVLQGRLDPRHPSGLPSADLGLRVILISQEGYSSPVAADVLVRIGILRVTDIIGGFEAWRSAGLPHRMVSTEPEK